jgi:hypothetical protein
MKTLVLGLMFCSVVVPAHAEVILFQCSWNDERPINIRVDTMIGKATRDDGGKSYTVIKATKWAVWLMVDEPENVAGMKFQMIQRAAAVRPDNSSSSPAGKWIDVVTAMTGSVSPIDGGRCWEGRK